MTYLLIGIALLLIVFSCALLVAAAMFIAALYRMKPIEDRTL